MSDQVVGRLRARASRLVDEIDARPMVAATFGPWFKTRLADDDWIKSLLLFNFTRPMEADQWHHLRKPEAEVLAHIRKQMALFPRGATTLDAEEHILQAFDRHAVGGIRNWFGEIGGPSGYWLDKRIHSLAWEMAAMAPYFEWSKVSKVRRLSTSGVPDYLIDMGPLVLVMEVKTLFGPSWPLVVLRTMLRALEWVGGMGEARRVMIVADDPHVGTAEVEDEVVGLSTDALVAAIRRVVIAGRDERVTHNLVCTLRTEAASSLRLEASYQRIGTMEDCDRLIARLTPSLESIKSAASDAWDQCDQHPKTPSRAMRLNAAAITAETWPGHPDLSSNQVLLRQWLEAEVWPQRPDRQLIAQFKDMFWPVWFVSPDATREIDRIGPPASATSSPQRTEQEG